MSDDEIVMIEINTIRNRVIEESAKELQNEVDKQILEGATMHEDCEFCIKRDICTRNVPKPCKYRYTEEERIADQASDMFGAILHKTYLHPTYRKKKEEQKMKATSVEVIKDVKGISFSVENYPAETESKLVIVATTDDDVFEFDFNGRDILKCCKAAGLFVGWEKDQKIRELEKDNKDLEKEYENKLDDIQRKYEGALREKYQIKDEYDKLNESLKNSRKDRNELNQKLYQVEMDKKRLTDRYKFLNDSHEVLTKAYEASLNDIKKLKEKLENVEPFRSLERTLREKNQLKEEYEEKLDVLQRKYNLDVLQRKYNLERATNEAQHKFIREYAGKDTEVTFNYAIDDTDEVSYVIVDKDKYQNLKDGNKVRLHGIDFRPDELVSRIFELEKLKRELKKEKEKILEVNRKLNERIFQMEFERQITPTIENFTDEESNDNVNHPSHYTGKYECIDVMQDVFGNEATDNFCLCNAFKYIWRAHKKNGLEDVKKAVWYLNKYIEEAEKDGVQEGERV